MTRRPDPETGIALILLFVAMPLCVAVLAGLGLIFWRWPYPTLAVIVVGWALRWLHVRLAQTTDRDGEPF